MHTDYIQPQDQQAFLDDISIFAPSINDLEVIIDQDYQEDVKDLIVEEEDDQKDREEKETRRNKFIRQLDLMIDLLENADPEKIDDEVDQKLSLLGTTIQENQSKALETIRPIEIVLRSIYSYFLNAGGGSDVGNAQFMLVDQKKFLGQNNKSHFEDFSKVLREKYYAWEMTESPAFIGVLGTTEQDANLLATLASETVSTAVIDARRASSPEATLKNALKRGLRGPDSIWAHLAVSGTWLVGRKAYPGLETEPLYIPSTPAVIGKLMGTETKDQITGFDNVGLLGTDENAYKKKSNTTDSPAFREAGMLLLAQTTRGVHILCDRTACETDESKASYKLSKMVIRNKIMKDLVAFANLKTDTRQTEAALKKTIQKYLNESQRKGYIVSYTGVSVKIGENGDVNITIGSIKYHETASKFVIAIEDNGSSIDAGADIEEETQESAS